MTVPQEVAEAFAADISNGNTDEAIALLDPGVEVTSDQGNTTGTEGTPEYVENPQQTYSGEAEAAAWLEGMAGQNPDIALGECAVDGQTVTCPANYADDALRAVSVLFIGWFGPRGIASILYVLTVVAAEDLAGIDTIYAAAMLTIFMSVLAHGLTAAPLSNRYGKRIADLDKQGAAGPEMMPVPEMPTRVEEVPIREAMSE